MNFGSNSQHVAHLRSNEQLYVQTIEQFLIYSTRDLSSYVAESKVDQRCNGEDQVRNALETEDQRLALDEKVLDMRTLSIETY